MSESTTNVQTIEIRELVEWLSSFGATNERGVTRLLYSTEWINAQQALRRKMNEAGMTTYFDGVGNLYGRIEGSIQGDSVILTGSHIDTVKQGGKYDGAYGVLASFLAVRRLVEKHGPPLKTIEVVSLCEEEGSRFPITFWGSKNITGEFSIASIDNISDTKGIPFKKAMNDAGFPIDTYSPKKRNDIEHFVEIHIEQGSILEKNFKDIGLVTHIVGQKRYTIMLTGESNHAGTTPMDERKDAMVCAAKAISQLTSMAISIAPGLRITAGQLIAKPNVPNVVAGNVSFTLDIRYHDKKVLDSYCENVIEVLKCIANESNIQLSVEKWTDIDPVTLDQSLHELIKKKIEPKGFSHMQMVSGAGHDAQVFGRHYPTTLIFIPSRHGISHSPLEFSEDKYLEKGIEVMMDTLYHLAYKGGNT
ncbi:allantoate amidohydrolase [Lysinibacillus sp. PLM2]|nr:allantoate amidohydrolase [Lysinibacillus sp. PLM2]